jgi:hypothetical protein
MRRRGILYRLRHWLFTAAVSWRRTREPDNVEQNDWRQQTHGSGLRFTERIRDHWRGRWLRIKSNKGEPN